MYTIAFRNKLLAVYFGTLALAKLVLTLASSFLPPFMLLALPSPPPPIPTDTFNLCPVVKHLGSIWFP